MTNELEKKFFDTFGIKPKTNREYGYTMAIYNEAGEEIKFYPIITDRILLELVVIMTRYTDIIEGFDSVDELKKFVLTDLMYSLTQSEADIVKHQVHTLFEEG